MDLGRRRSSVTTPHFMNETRRGSGLEGGVLKARRSSIMKASASVEQEKVTESIEVKPSPFFLSYEDPYLEMEYCKFFVTRNKRTWRKSACILIVLTVMLFVYSVVKTPLEYQEYLDDLLSIRQQDPEFYTLGDQKYIDKHCPAGYFCTACPSRIRCEPYNLAYDIVLFIAGTLPMVLLVLASYKLQEITFARHIHSLTGLALSFGALFGFLLRFCVIEPNESTYMIGILFTFFLYASFILLRVRFSVTIISISLLILAFFVSFSIIKWHSGLSEVFITTMCLIGAAFVVSVSNFETETFYRSQFISSKQLMKANAKLKNQLKVIQKNFGNKVGDLDSPLEKSFMILKSLQADPGLSAGHLANLGQLIFLLNSPNLLSPDLEKVVEGSDGVDNEQEAWLFSEIAKRPNRSKGPLRLTHAITLESGGTMTTRNTSKTGLAIGTMSLDSNSFSSKIEVEQFCINANLKANVNLEPYYTQMISYDFPIFDFQVATNSHPLFFMGHYLFKRANLFTTFEIIEEKFLKFLIKIEQGYHDELPYHNSMHAADVLHAVSYFAEMETINKYVHENDYLALYIAAIIHDYDHPGLTNNFLVNTGEARALLYNDKAVLENHHLSSAFRVLSKDEFNFLGHLPHDTLKSLRENIIEIVLATDLSQHFNLLAMFKNKVSNSDTFNPEVREDKILLWKVLLKCADVSNPTKEWNIYGNHVIDLEKWVKLIIQEFWDQGDEERKRSMKISPYMDRENCDIPSCQLGFINFVVGPLFDAFGKYVPLKEIGESFQKNKERYAYEKERVSLNSSQKFK